MLWPEEKKFVPNWSHQIHSIEEHLNVNQADSDEDELSEFEFGERIEWMFLAQLSSKSTENVSVTLDCQVKYCQQQRSKSTLQQMWYDVKIKKNAKSFQYNKQNKVIDIL